MSTFIQEEYRRRLSVWCDIQGHMEFMHDTVLKYPEPKVIELGVNTGNSTSALLAAVEEARGVLCSCDITPPLVPPEFPASDSWQFWCADDMSPGALEWMPPQCDVLFIDTDHSYEHTKLVLAAYVPRVRRGGTVLLHDTEWQWPSTQLPGPTSTVAQGLNEYCAGAGLARENRTGFYGMGVIRI